MPCFKQHNKIKILHLTVVPKLSGGWQHNYSTKTRQASHANEQSIYYVMSMVFANQFMCWGEYCTDKSLSTKWNVDGDIKPKKYWKKKKKLNFLIGSNVRIIKIFFNVI
jgi:hypothetical protein